MTFMNKKKENQFIPFFEGGGGRDTPPPKKSVYLWIFNCEKETRILAQPIDLSRGDGPGYFLNFKEEESEGWPLECQVVL